MRWVRSRDCYRVQEYPYFAVIVENLAYYYKSPTYTFKGSGKLYSDLEEAKKDCILHIKHKLLADDFRFEVTTWPNNIGSGKYIKDWCQGVRYLWLCAGSIPWYSTYNDFAIRLPEGTSQEEALKIGDKIYRRHKNRFLKEISYDASF